MTKTRIPSLDIFFDYIKFLTYFYTPTKYNKKKIKQMFETLPYFLPLPEQNKLYKLFLKYPVESFYETTEKMKEYGYLIYVEYHKAEHKRYDDYPTYLSHLENKLYKEDMTYRKKRTHTIIFSIVIIILIYYLYKLK